MQINLHGVTGIHLGLRHDINGTPTRRVTITTTDGPVEFTLFAEKDDPASVVAHFWDDAFPQHGEKLEHLVTTEEF